MLQSETDLDFEDLFLALQIEKEQPWNWMTLPIWPLNMIMTMTPRSDDLSYLTLSNTDPWFMTLTFFSPFHCAWPLDLMFLSNWPLSMNQTMTLTFDDQLCRAAGTSCYIFRSAGEFPSILLEHFWYSQADSTILVGNLKVCLIRQFSVFSVPFDGWFWFAFERNKTSN